jgi:hypothetical protein
MVSALLVHWLVLQLLFLTGTNLAEDADNLPPKPEPSRDTDLDYRFEIFLDPTVSLCSPVTLRWEGGNPLFEVHISTKQGGDPSNPPSDFGKTYGETKDWNISLDPPAGMFYLPASSFYRAELTPPLVLDVNIGDIIWYTVIDQGGSGKAAFAGSKQPIQMQGLANKD